MKHEDVAIPVYQCKTCGYRQDSATAVGKDASARPRKGDLSVCLKCGTITQFDEHMNQVALTQSELEGLAVEHPDVYGTLRRAQVLIGRQSKSN